MMETYACESSVNFDESQMSKLFTTIQTHDAFMACVNKAKNVHFCNNLEEAFCFLFSYDYLFLTHKCMCQHLNNCEINEEDIAKLLDSIA